VNDAFGSESCRLRASPPIKSYWLRCASSSELPSFPLERWLRLEAQTARQRNASRDFRMSSVRASLGSFQL
jgi:hypothetical protein